MGQAHGPRTWAKHMGNAMKLPRRTFLYLAADAITLSAVSRLAWADTYPSRPVRFIVGFPAGNASDVLARLMGQGLSDRLAQKVVVENRPGAGSNVGTEAVVRAPPDGYTLLLISPSNALNKTLYEKLNFDFINDIAPIASICHNPYVVAVTPSFPAKTVPEFITYAKSNPGKVNMASTGIGTTTHVFGELFKTMAGVDLAHVPYRGNFVPDLISGHVQVVFAPITHLIAYLRSGQIRALAVTTVTRAEALPDVPTLAEFVPGYEATGWYGIGAPKGTPAEVIDKLNKETGTVLADPQFSARLIDLAAVPTPMTPAEFKKFIGDETERWAKVIQAAGIKAE
jgi:tripartite-type tricarboxylate transporter receptor subunit TctC